MAADGAYVAYNDDMSKVVVESGEMKALRYAMKNGLHVGYVKFGEEFGADNKPTLPDPKEKKSTSPKPSKPTAVPAE